MIKTFCSFGYGRKQLKAYKRMVTIARKMKTEMNMKEKRQYGLGDSSVVLCDVDMGSKLSLTDWFMIIL